MVQQDLIDDTRGPWALFGLYVAGLAGGVALMVTAATIGGVDGAHQGQVLIAGTVVTLVAGVAIWLRWRWLRPVAAGLVTVGVISAGAILLIVAAFWNLTA